MSIMSSSAREPGDGPNIPDRGWENPFPEGDPLHDLYGGRVRNEQDLLILIDDYHARRGTGKTVASLQLAEGMDQNGGLTWANVSMSPEEIRNAYEALPERSGVVFDEGEVGASNREAMTRTNQALREIVAMGRVEEKYLVVNTPSVGFIDKDIRLMADVWITMITKGVGLVHFLPRLPYASQLRGKLLTKKQDPIRFRDIKKGTRLRELYNRLTEEKRGHIRGEGGGGFIPKDEHREELKKARKQARQETRNEIIQSLYTHPDSNVSQRIIGESVGLTQQQIGNILRSDS